MAAVGFILKIWEKESNNLLKCTCKSTQSPLKYEAWTFLPEANILKLNNSINLHKPANKEGQGRANNNNTNELCNLCEKGVMARVQFTEYVCKSLRK